MGYYIKLIIITIVLIVCNCNVKEKYDIFFYNYYIDNKEVKYINLKDKSYFWPIKANNYRINLIKKKGLLFCYNSENIKKMDFDSIVCFEYSSNYIFREVIVNQFKIQYNISNIDLSNDTIVFNFRENKRNEINLLSKYFLDFIEISPYDNNKPSNLIIFIKHKNQDWKVRTLSNNDNSENNILGFIDNFIKNVKI